MAQNIDALPESYPSNPFITSATLLLVLLLLTVVFILRIVKFQLSSQTLPPGPKGWPIVGCLFQMKKYLTSELEDLLQKYGPIVTLKIVSTPVILIADADIVHEAFAEKGFIFVSRPRVPSATVFSSNFKTISMSEYGPVWRTLRKHLTTAIMRSSKASSDLRDVREELAQDLMLRFRDEAARSGGVVEVRQAFKYGVFELLLSICFGKHAEERVVVTVAHILEQILIRSSSLGIDVFLPWLSFLAWSRTKKKDQQLRQQQLDNILPLIKEAQMLRQDGKLTAGSYIEALLEMELEGEKLSDDEIVTLCSEFLIAATDSTVTTLEWAMANIISHPHIQSEIVNEIQRVVGKRAAREDDIENLPYLKAVVKETLRRHPPGYFTFPYTVSQPCKLKGYDIPANALLFASISSISSDPRIWEDPTEFKPERFVGTEIDITGGSKKITMIPFGTGRRICPGMGLATLHINFILARLMQSFEWAADPSAPHIDLTPTLEVTMQMKSPLRALISNR